MTMRWNRSRWVPIAWATSALIGSAWDTQTIVPPGCLARSLSTAVTIRDCISVKLSPLGKRNVDGARCTVVHSGSFISALSSAPVHSPKSHSTQPAVDLHLHAAGRGDRRRGLACPLQRRGVDRIDGLQLGDALGDPLGLLRPRIGQVQAGRPPGQDGTGGRCLAVAHEEHDGGGRGSGFFLAAMSTVEPNVGAVECDRAGATRSPAWPRCATRSSPAGPARGWSPGASRWPATSAPRSATRTTGGGRCRGSATRTRRCSCSAWHRRRTGRTAPGGCSPVTVRATSCSPRCTAPASPTSRRRWPPTTACASTARG